MSILYLDFIVEGEVGGVERVFVGDHDTVAGAVSTASEVGVLFLVTADLS